MKRSYRIGFVLAALAFAGPISLLAQSSVSTDWPDFLIVDGKTAYDDVNGITWLRDANLAVTTDVNAPNPNDQPPRFGLPLCDADSTENCIWASGAMDYPSAREWVRRMNAASYLGHDDWRLPGTPFVDPSCAQIGPSGESFGFGCTEGAMGFLYYRAFGMRAPNTAIPIPPNTVGPFINFQPNYYWSQTFGGGLPNNKADFSFEEGSHGGSTPGDYLYVLPMVKGRIPGTPAPTGTGLEVSPDGLTIYDPVANVTWAANADLAAQNSFGLPTCTAPKAPSPCIAADGSMNYAATTQFIAGMNAANYGAQTEKQLTWELPTQAVNCPTYDCTNKTSPMGELFYNQLGFQPGQPIVPTPDIAVGPFHDVQPGHYWSCEALTIRDACDGEKKEPAANSEFGFSFENGYVGTARLTGIHFVMVYFVGCDLPDAEQCIRVKNPGPRKF